MSTDPVVSGKMMLCVPRERPPEEPLVLVVGAHAANFAVGQYRVLFQDGRVSHVHKMILYDVLDFDFEVAE